MKLPSTIITLALLVSIGLSSPWFSHSGAAQAQFVTNTPLPAATTTPTSSEFATPTPTPRITPTLSVTVEPFVEMYAFDRPIPRGADLQDFGTRVYPYGGTQFSNFDVHLGLDFINPRFTPVLAAGPGVVIFAGDDSEVMFGPYLNYYGNLIVIEHDLVSVEGLTVYTLYAHLERVDVAVGSQVAAGDPIGAVGATGIALGPHLHFEVRVGDPVSYLATRNPDFWIKPYPGFGTLAGRVTSTSGDVKGQVVLIRSNGRTREAYVYGGDRVNSDPSWNENFTYADLPAGVYEVLISERGRVRFRADVTIEDGKTTFIEIDLD
ncbi:MAG: M23 family metallopeptidase [Anaerolineae bacterium]